MWLKKKYLGTKGQKKEYSANKCITRDLEAITEILIGKKHVVPFFLENELPKRGAVYEKVYVHEPLVIVSGNGRLITGQNPESATNEGEKVVEILKGGQAT
jgi:putative intracellular protease/amidase